MEELNFSKKNDKDNVTENSHALPVDVQTISIDDYIKASVNAGDRVRQLIYILSFASAIAFMAYWNSKDKGWINERFDKILEGEEKYLGSRSDTINLSLFKLVPCKFQAAEEKKIDSFLRKREINSTAKFKAYDKIYTSLKETTFKVNVPILGINFDINDLGLFSGITFNFLLFLLLLSIAREEENLEITFRFAVENNILNRIYIYLTMGQVLSYPPIPFVDKINKSLTSKYLKYIRKHCYKALYLIPSIVQFMIIFNDFKTEDAGNTLNELLTSYEFHMAIILLLISIFLGSACIKKGLKMDHIWLVYFKLSTLDTSPKI